MCPSHCNTPRCTRIFPLPPSTTCLFLARLPAPPYNAKGTTMAEHPNILLLQSDEHSYRFLSTLSHEQGGEPCNTPTLDGLIDKGTWFTTSYCSMPLCSPSRISMLCGRHSHRCGAWGNNAILPPDLPTFAAQLGAHGYATCNVGCIIVPGVRNPFR